MYLLFYNWKYVSDIERFIKAFTFHRYIWYEFIYILAINYYYCNEIIAMLNSKYFLCDSMSNAKSRVLRYRNVNIP